MKPTQDQVTAWAREAGFATSWTEAAGEALECFATLAYEAGRKERIMTETEYSGNGTAGREADVKPTGFFFQMPKREWQGLTDEEVRDLWSWAMTVEAERTANTQQHAFARAIEAKLKEKNG